VGVVLLIPPGGGLDVPEKIAKQPKRKPAHVKTLSTPKENYVPTADDGTYVVRPGDTLWKIARHNKISTKSLADANNVDLRKAIQPGMKLVIPGGGAKTADIDNNDDSEQTSVSNSDELDVDVKVDAKVDDKAASTDDENLLDDAMDAADSPKTDAPAAKKSVDDVLDELDSSSVVTKSTETPGSPYTEEVIPNETLQEIADRHGCTVEEILKVNPNLKSEDDLKPFTSIIIPKK
jgi:LysM repeat protein